MNRFFKGNQDLDLDLDLDDLVPRAPLPPKEIRVFEGTLTLLHFDSSTRTIDWGLKADGGDFIIIENPPDQLNLLAYKNTPVRIECTLRTSNYGTKWITPLAITPIPTEALKEQGRLDVAV